MLKTLALLLLATFCIMQVVCLPKPDLSDELTKAESSVNTTLESWKKGFQSLFEETNQLDSLLVNLGTQLQTLSDNIGNLTKHLEESISTSTEPPSS